MVKKISALVLIFIFTVIPVWAETTSQIDRTTVNGMTILLQKTDSDLAEVMLLLKSGSGLDGKKKGTAELMNTLVYLKLKNTPTEIGEVNVVTMPDFTQVRIKTSAENVGEVLQEIKDLLSSPLYSYDIIEDLKQLISSQINGLPGYAKTYYEMTKNFYGVEHPYNDQLDSETIKAISGIDVYRWYRKTYQPGNAILSISGGVKQDIKEVEKIYTQMVSESVDRRLLISPVFPKEDQRVEREDPNARIASFCMGFAAPRIQDSDYPAFRIIKYFLGDYQHYFEELRVKKGLLYTDDILYSYLEHPQAPDIIFLTMTDPQNLDRVETETLKVVGDLIKKGIDQNVITEIADAIESQGKAEMTANRGAAFRNAMSFYLQNQLVYDENLWPKLKQVTTEDIKKAAAKYFTHHVQVAYIPKSLGENF